MFVGMMIYKGLDYIDIRKKKRKHLHQLYTTGGIQRGILQAKF